MQLEQIQDTDQIIKAQVQNVENPRLLTLPEATTIIPNEFHPQQLIEQINEDNKETAVTMSVVNTRNTVLGDAETGLVPSEELIISQAQLETYKSTDGLTIDAGIALNLELPPIPITQDYEPTSYIKLHAERLTSVGSIDLVESSPIDIETEVAHSEQHQKSMILEGFVSLDLSEITQEQLERPEPLPSLELDSEALHDPITLQEVILTHVKTLPETKVAPLIPVMERLLIVGEQLARLSEADGDEVDLLRSEANAIIVWLMDELLIDIAEADKQRMIDLVMYEIAEMNQQFNADIDFDEGTHERKWFQPLLFALSDVVTSANTQLKAMTILGRSAIQPLSATIS